MLRVAGPEQNAVQRAVGPRDQQKLADLALEVGCGRQRCGESIIGQNDGRLSLGKRMDRDCVAVPGLKDDV